MAHPTPQFGAGDRVCTNQCVHRLHAGTMGTIQRVSDTGAMFDVLFVGRRLPLLMFHDQLEAPPPQNQENDEEGRTSTMAGDVRIRPLADRMALKPAQR